MGYRPSLSRIDARHPAHSRDPSLHMRIVGGSRDPRGRPLWARQQDIVHWENGQTGPRERVDLSLPSLSFASLFSRKTPFPKFSIKINHIGVQLYVREHTAAFMLLDMRQLGHRGFRIRVCLVPRRAPAVLSRVFLSRAWPCVAFNAARDAFHLSWDSASTFPASSWTPGNFVAVASPIAAAIVFTTLPRLIADVGRRPAIRNEKNSARFRFQKSAGFHFSARQTRDWWKRIIKNHNKRFLSTQLANLI